MNNCFPISRDVISDFRSKLPKRAYSNAYFLLMHILIEARHEDGSVYGVPLKRGQLLRGRFALSKETGLSEKEIRVATKNLIVLNEISLERANERANETNIITCINYDIWCDSYLQEGQRKGQERAKRGPTEGHKQEGEEGKEGKEEVQILTSLSANADRDANRTDVPRETKQPIKKTRTPKPNSGDAFVTWVDTAYPSVPTRKAWSRYVKQVNGLLADRQRVNPTGAYDEIVMNFEKLMAGEFDVAWPWSEGNPKEIPNFCQHYGDLLAARNGKATSKNPLVCPDHGPMTRENVNGNIVYFCKEFKHGCPHVYRSEAIWTDRMQNWETKAL